MAGTVTVDQAKLVLNSFAAIFQNNLTSAELVTWRKFDNEMNDRNALTVVEQVTPRYVVTRTTSGIQDLTTPGTQSTVFGSEQYSVNTVFSSSMGFLASYSACRLASSALAESSADCSSSRMVGIIFPLFL